MHAHLKNGFMEDEKYHNLMTWLIYLLCISEQSPEETEKTKQFCLEVVDLLKHSHQYHMMFNKFIPSYHHHFGRQCRVSDYGFTKLQDLFDAIPHIVEVCYSWGLFFC